MHIGQFHMNKAQLIFIPKYSNKYVMHDLGYKGDLTTMSQYLSLVILPRYAWSQQDRAKTCLALTSLQFDDPQKSGNLC